MSWRVNIASSSNGIGTEQNKTTVIKRSALKRSTFTKMSDAGDEIVMLDPRRNQAAERKKLYEEMLLKEMPGTRRPNEPMHAVLESELGDSENGEGHEAQNVRNHALIHYLANLATSNDTKDTFDFDFVESLLNNGADINSNDKSGQTVFHEVARSWNIDVASFLIQHGANINQQDHFGRSPLHVAAAVDYAEMVEFLLQNGADINIKTKDQAQTPVHFAAKNDAINSLQMLLGYGADIDVRDNKNRTPLQVCAEMNRSKAARLLISEGAPTGVYDNLGNSALSLLIEKIPEAALDAMDQFHSVDPINRKEFYFLNYLEGPRLMEEKTPARTPLEIAVQNKRYDIILHPVMQRLIAVQWQMYGKWGAIRDLVINLFYAVLWTTIGITLPLKGKDLYLPLATHAWRLVLGSIIVLLTILEIRKQITNTIKTRQELKKWREWRAAELERDLQYCHPRWPQETQYLQAEIKAVRDLSLIAGSDWWIYFDWVALVLILATIITHMTFFHMNTSTSKEVHHYFIIPLLLVLWLRILKYARPFESAGPFVVIFGSVLGDIVKWAFLNAVIIVPFTCAFWITFGAVSLTPVPGYDSLAPLLYNMFSMMVVNDHEYEALEKANPVMARLLCGGFIGIVAIVTLNLLIALLSNTFERLYENAVANAVMQRACTILLLQKSMRKTQKTKYYEFIKTDGSPEVINNDLGCVRNPTDREDHASIDKVREDIALIVNVLSEQFGRKFGGNKNKKSTLDFVKMDVSKVRRCQEELMIDVRNLKGTLEGLHEKLEALTQKCTNIVANTTFNTTNNNNNNNAGAPGTKAVPVILGVSGDAAKDSNVSHSGEGSRNNTPKKTIDAPVKKAVIVHKVAKTIGAKNGKPEGKFGKSAKKGSDDEDSSSDSESSDDASDNQHDEETDGKKNKRKRKEKAKEKRKSKREKKEKKGNKSDKEKERDNKAKSELPPKDGATKPPVNHSELAYPPGRFEPYRQDDWRNNSATFPRGMHERSYPASSYPGRWYSRHALLPGVEEHAYENPAYSGPQPPPGLPIAEQPRMASPRHYSEPTAFHDYQQRPNAYGFEPAVLGQHDGQQMPIYQALDGTNQMGGASYPPQDQFQPPQGMVPLGHMVHSEPIYYGSQPGGGHTMPSHPPEDTPYPTHSGYHTLPSNVRQPDLTSLRHMSLPSGAMTPPATQYAPLPENRPQPISDRRHSSFVVGHNRHVQGPMTQPLPPEIRLYGSEATPPVQTPSPRSLQTPAFHERSQSVPAIYGVVQSLPHGDLGPSAAPLPQRVPTLVKKFEDEHGDPSSASSGMPSDLQGGLSQHTSPVPMGPPPTNPHLISNMTPSTITTFTEPMVHPPTNTLPITSPPTTSIRAPSPQRAPLPVVHPSTTHPRTTALPITTLATSKPTSSPRRAPSPIAYPPETHSPTPPLPTNTLTTSKRAPSPRRAQSPMVPFTIPPPPTTAPPRAPPQDATKESEGTPHTSNKDTSTSHSNSSRASTSEDEQNDIDTESMSPVE